MNIDDGMAYLVIKNRIRLQLLCGEITEPQARSRIALAKSAARYLSLHVSNHVSTAPFFDTSFTVSENGKN